MEWLFFDVHIAGQPFWFVFFVYFIPMGIAIKALIELISIRRLLEERNKIN